MKSILSILCEQLVAEYCLGFIRTKELVESRDAKSLSLAAAKHNDPRQLLVLSKYFLLQGHTVLGLMLDNYFSTGNLYAARWLTRDPGCTQWRNFKWDLANEYTIARERNSCF